MTHTKEVSDRISKKKNVVSRSAENMTPSVAAKVRMVKTAYRFRCSRSCLKYSRENRDVSAHIHMAIRP